MPTYEYVCVSCKRRVEAVQSFSDAPLTTCEECGGTLKRVFHPVGILLKGGGFYSTDNRAARKPTTKEPAKTEPAKSDSSSSTSSAPAPPDKPKKGGSGGSKDKAAS